jgi:hypothetical protein
MSYTDTTKLDLKKADPGTNQPFETEVFNDNLDKIDAEAVAIDARLDAVEAADVVLDSRLDAVEANDWVTRARIAVGAVGPNELDTYSVVSSKIAPESVTSAELASNSVGSDELQPNSVGASELQSSSVTEPKLASGSVSNAKLQGGLDASKLAFGTLNPSLLPDGSLGASKLSSYLDLTLKGVYVSVDGGSATSVVNLGFMSDVISAQFSARNTPGMFASGSVTATPSSGLITVDLTGYGFTAAPVVTANIFGATTAKLIVTLDTVSATQVKFKVWTSTFANSTTSTRIDWQAVQG